ncbi:MAG: hypothetical protein AB1716_12040 [Planctomycetota bacterium]
MPSLFETLKPAASARVHLLLAALLWTAVGIGLLTAGLRWALAGGRTYMAVLVVVAMLAGVLKAEFVLARTARRVISRIQARGDHRCAGGFLSVRTWLFVLLMMALGYTLRHGLLPHEVVGVIYVAVGAALLVASRRFWIAWRHARRSAPG